MKPLVIVGAGGFGREVLGIVNAINGDIPTWKVIGVLDDDVSDARRAAVARVGTSLLGPVAALPDMRAAAVIAIGAPVVRASVHHANPGTEWATLIHPQATVGRGTQIGAGTIIAPGARLSTGIRTGLHAHVDQNATVGHDATIGDHVRLNPQACISGSVTLGHRDLIGAAAVVLEGRILGVDILIGAGSVVTHSLLTAGTYTGTPARKMNQRKST